MLEIILNTFLSGVVGTGLGGLIGVLFGKKSEKHMSILLSFSGGIMLSVVCFDLIVESINLSNILYTAIFSVVGVIIIMLINTVVDKYFKFNEVKELSINKYRLLKSGLIMVIAIGIHNFPEGLAVGSSFSYDTKMGLFLSLLIAFHNLPEGMAISAPLVGGEMSKVKAVMLTALSGVPTIIGGVIGHFIGSASNIGVAFSLAFASGAMLYVVFYEIIPQSLLMSKSNLNSLFILIGMLVGLIFISGY